MNTVLPMECHLVETECDCLHILPPNNHLLSDHGDSRKNSDCWPCIIVKAQTPHNPVKGSHLPCRRSTTALTSLEETKIKFGINPKKGLTPKQLMHGHLMCRLLTSSIYWVRFYTSRGGHVVRSETAKNVPFPTLPLVMAMMVNLQQA